MKNADEIKKALQCCSEEKCSECPYYDEETYDECTGNMAKDALEYIGLIEMERNQLIDALKGYDGCTYCKHNGECDGHCECEFCENIEKCACFACTTKNNHWEWRGVIHDKN